VVGRGLDRAHPKPLTLDLLQSDCSDLIWCHSERGMLSRQPSCPEATARCADCPMTSFFVFQQDGAPTHRARDTVALLERETRYMRSRLSARVRVRGAHFEHEF